tara:strand:- start:4240 stop:4638 length:399 start_codon:yes stop_codon:yes gene_type:complete
LKLTPKQLHILQHSLGCDQFGQSKHRGRDEHDGCFGFYRNRYVCGPRAEIAELVVAGLMKDYGPQSIASGMHCFAVTRAGILAMDEQSPNPPKLTKGQQRYRAYLRADYWNGTFLEFCRWMDARKREGLEAV